MATDDEILKAAQEYRVALESQRLALEADAETERELEEMRLQAGDRLKAASERVRSARQVLLALSQAKGL